MMRLFYDVAVIENGSSKPFSFMIRPMLFGIDVELHGRIFSYYYRSMNYSRAPLCLTVQVTPRLQRLQRL
jgi:hypothetical protein